MVHLQFNGTVEEVKREMQTFLGSGGSVDQSAKPASIEKAAKPAKNDAALVPAEAKQAATPAAPAPQNTPSLQDVKVLLPTLMAKIGKPGVVEFFAKHFAPATKGSELKPEQYAEFVSKANEILK